MPELSGLCCIKWACPTQPLKISALRAAASGAADDQGVFWNGRSNLVPTDFNALTFARTTTQVLNIVYLGGASGNYGFFPQGLNGAIA